MFVRFCEVMITRLFRKNNTFVLFFLKNKFSVLIMVPLHGQVLEYTVFWLVVCSSYLTQKAIVTTDFCSIFTACYIISVVTIFKVVIYSGWFMVNREGRPFFGNYQRIRASFAIIFIFFSGISL